MALKVWMPLNGNTVNQGTDAGITVTNTGTVDTAGKIGLCYSYASTYTLLSGDTIRGLDKFTIACWVYPTSESHCVFTAEDTNGYWQFVLANGYLRIRDTVTGQTGTRIDHTLAYAIPKGIWTHVTIVYNSGVITIYYDGYQTEQFTAHAGASMISASSFTRLYIGQDPLNSYTGNCKVNDFRVWDCCLSKQEIRELSRGLVLHYKMDIPQRNLITSQKSSTPTQYLAYQYNIDPNFSAGAKYTFQLWDVNVSHTGKTESQLGIGIYWGGGNINLKTIVGSPTFVNGHADYIKFTITAPSSTSSNKWINIYNSPGSASGTLSMSIGAIKIEKYNSYSTSEGSPFVPYGQNISAVEDCSGYRYDSDVSGIIEPASYKSPRYTNCTVFPATSYTDRLSPTNQVRSAAFWLYLPSLPTSSSQKYQVAFVDYASRLGFVVGLSSYFSCSAGTSSDLSPRYSTKPLTAGKFHHIVVVNRGQSATDMDRRVYIDGKELSPMSDTDYWTCPVDHLRVGGRGTTTNNTTCYISDFRLYVTSLEYEDVQDLYHTSAIVDNLGNLHTFQATEGFSENNEETKITKTGDAFTDTFAELGSLTKVLSDGSVWLHVLHHQNPASNLFTADNCWNYDNGSTLYSALWLLKNDCWKINGVYELLACEKLTSSSSEVQYRWTQTSNPALSSSVTGFTAITGSSQYFTGLLTNGTKGAMHNGGSWWCCCGDYTSRSSGLPGFGGNVTSGSLDLYIRILPKSIMGASTDSPFSIYADAFLQNNLIEV